MNFLLLRDNDPQQAHNWGQLFVEDADGELLGQTLEDPDRRLEDGGEKVDGDTAIPRGRYRISITMSSRFKRLMPLIHDVPDFDGIRIHGGNTEVDTHGCPLLGQHRNDMGIDNCKAPNERLMNYLLVMEKRGEEVWLEVK